MVQKEQKEIMLKQFVFLIYVVFCFFSYVLLFVSKGNFTTMAVLAIAQILFVLFILRRFHIKIISPITLFLIMSFLFHYGQIILFGFNIPISKGIVDIRDYVSMDIIVETFNFVYFVHAALILGVFIVFRKNNKYIGKKENHSLKLKKMQNVRMIGWICIIIGILPTIITQYSIFRSSLTGGYVDTFANMNYGFIYVLSDFFRYGLLFLIVGYRNEKKKAFFVTSVLVAFCILLMLTGHRMTNVIHIILTLYIYFSIVQKKRRKRIIIPAVITGYLGMGFLIFIRNTRFFGVLNIENPVAYFFQTVFASPIPEILSETGSSLLTVCYSIIHFPETAQYGFGTSYLLSIFTVLPNLGGFLEVFQNRLVYVYNFPLDSAGFYSFIGGSYIGEMFYNFGYFSYIFAFFVGSLLGILTKKMEYAKQDGNWTEYLVLIMAISWSLFWVRDYFSSFMRIFVWLLIIILIFGLHRIKRTNADAKKVIYGNELGQRMDSLLNETHKTAIILQQKVQIFKGGNKDNESFKEN